MIASKDSQEIIAPTDIDFEFTDNAEPTTMFSKLNFKEGDCGIPEVPFIHWSIYRQAIQNSVNQQGHKFQKNQK